MTALGAGFSGTKAVLLLLPGGIIAEIEMALKARNILVDEWIRSAALHRRRVRAQN
jgi:hypothetical protein